MKSFLLFFLLFSYTLEARELKMATIKSDVDRNTTEFLMEVDDQSTIHSIRIKTTTHSGSIFEDFTVSADEVMSSGAVLRMERGYVAVRMEVEKSFSITEGGGIILDYLVSGVSGYREKMTLKLIKKGSDFVLQTNTGAPINHFFFKGNRHPVLGVVGVRDIVLSQQ